MLLSSITMSNSANVAQVFSTFVNLTKELKPFVKTDDLRIAFDSEGKVYLIGDGYSCTYLSILQTIQKISVVPHARLQNRKELS